MGYYNANIGNHNFSLHTSNIDAFFREVEDEDGNIDESKAEELSKIMKSWIDYSVKEGGKWSKEVEIGIPARKLMLSEAGKFEYSNEALFEAGFEILSEKRLLPLEGIGIVYAQSYDARPEYYVTSVSKEGKASLSSEKSDATTLKVRNWNDLKKLGELGIVFVQN